MEKKAVIAVQFHWIFVIIAGALILIFFGNLIFKHKDVADVQISSTVITDFDAILTGALVSTDTVNIIDIPKLDINFECDKFNIGQVKKQTQDRIIFSPDLIKGGTLITYGTDWSYPYRISNILYLTTPQVRYIIVDDVGEMGEYLNDSLPTEINKELIDRSVIDSGNLQNLNDYRVKFIYLSTGDLNLLEAKSLAPFQDMLNQHVSAIVVEKDSNTPELGHVTFYQKQGLNWEFQEIEQGYYTKESLMGAVYAADYDMYKCGMDKAFKKLNIITNIVLNRTTRLKDDYGVGHDCYSIYEDAEPDLNSIATDSSGEFSYNAANFIYTTLNNVGVDLKDINQRAQLYSCVLIY
jgi:hypothetical protein